MMRECIKLDMQCANICRLAAQFMTLNSGSARIFAVFALMFVRSAVTSVESMNMTIVRIAQALVITAPNNAERWPPEKLKLPNPLRRGFIPGNSRRRMR
jgi:hypothetical protein